MFYKFPVITHLDQVREAIAGREEFIIAEREWGFVANYLVNLADTFPYPNTKDEKTNELYKIRRECRGLKFDLNGNPLARLFHKFHNYGERSEVDGRNVDFNHPFILLDKLDGSMIHPIFFNNKVVVCTKMGITDIAIPVQGFIERGIAIVNDSEKKVDYIGFMNDMMKAGWTPLFEWCSRKQRIVVDYGVHDYLILTAIRHIITGEYKSYDEMVILAKQYDIPVVERWNGTFDGINEFMSLVQGKEGEEGCVGRFENGEGHGHMLKFKNLWYCQLHKTKELLQFEKDVWSLIITEKQDDAKAFMDDEDKERIDSFAADLYKAMDDFADRLKWEVIAWTDNHGDSQKKFAVDFVNNDKHGFSNHERGLLFKIKNDMENARPLVYDYILGYTSTGPKINEIRNLLGGINWEDY